jgi:hypothetical protein
MMRCRASFHPYETRWQLLEEADHLAAPKLFRDNDLASGIDTVSLEHRLGEIQTDRANLHVDGPLM